MRNGSRRVHREAVNRGHPERPVANADVVTKFMDNAGLHFSAGHAQAICTAVLGLDQAASVAPLEALLANDPQP